MVRTGGLEAAAAIHVMNNVFTFGQAGLTGTISAVFTVSQVPWYTSVGSVVLFAVMAALCYLVARKMHLQTRVGGVGLTPEVDFSTRCALLET